MYFRLNIFKKTIYLTIILIIISTGDSATFIQNPPIPRSKEDSSPPSPYKEEIIYLLKEKSANKQHPRLMATADDFKRIRRQIETDQNSKRWYRILTVEANRTLQEPTVKYQFLDGVRLLPISQTVLKRTTHLALMYKLTNNYIYADRAWKELSTVADDKQFPDWHPEHFLDTAEMTAAVAIGYDWLYDYLSSEQKKILRKALMEKGLQPALSIYRSSSNSWKDATNNWNTVCNSGISLGALAIADESSETEAISGEILQNAVQSIKNSLSQYGPDGGMAEGPSYWNYATIYMTYFLSSLDSTLGTDYGLSKLKGLSETGYYPMYVMGPAGFFNIGDAKSSRALAPAQMFWMSDKYKKMDLAYFSLKGKDPMNLIWYKKNKLKNLSTSSIPLDKHFANPETGLVTMRSTWKNNNALFAGIHGGSNQVTHGDLDIGDFILDALGVRWASDLGADNYNLPGYFGMNRWNYYRKRAEGQNTLVINPGMRPDQNTKAIGEITKFSSSPNQAFAIVNMTTAYTEDAVSAKRGLALTKKRTMVVLQDELTLKKPSEVYWFMHTEAQVGISVDKKTAILTRSGKKLYAHIISPQEGTFSVIAATPLPTTPSLSNQNDNEGINKLTIHLNGVSTTTISVVFSLHNEGEKVPTQWSQPLPLAKWSESMVLNQNN